MTPAELDRLEALWNDAKPKRPWQDINGVLVVNRGVTQHYIEILYRDAPALIAALRQAWEERDRLQAFKTWVHARLDAMGVPADPDPDGHQQHGCRIGGRMQWLQDQLALARSMNHVEPERS